MSTYKIKRIYDKPTSDDGYRVLVDRLWPRGVSKEKAALDEWNKDVAPSSELRTWFGHKPELLEEFSTRYEEEMRKNPAVREFQKRTAAHKTVTLLYAAHDSQTNHATVLLKFLQEVR